MSQFRSIVCPVDFSDHSLSALRYAVGLAGHERASLAVLTVNDPLLVDAARAAAFPADYVDEEAENELRDFVAKALPAGAAWAPQSDLLVRTGEPEIEIFHCAAEREADLIVMGTHGLSGYRKVFFGSVTERVLRQTHTPVLAVPLTDRPMVTLSAQQPSVKIGIVLVPVDFSAASTAQARTAAALAQRFGGSLLFVHVVIPPGTATRFRQKLAAQQPADHTVASEKLARFAAGVGATVPLETQVTAGQPAEEISRLASQHDVGLIVMGLSGEGAASGRPGATAYRILTLAPVPVLALPHRNVAAAN
jgi:nucleotide-binding universal stress UspA family protein